MKFWYRLPFRTRLGIVSAVLLVLAAVSMYLWISDPIHNKPISALIRFAPIMLLLCLAWVELKNIPRWFWLAVPIVLLAGFIKPAIWFLIVPAVLVWLFVRN
ncbi:MAG: hypothetical protein LBT89_10265 [Planctomycetaceae bacterium]|jgi:hypothetical protein|nr:hypothetical protein [Planctomycetaceae bacterium]